jgi:hypothetical protein
MAVTTLSPQTGMKTGASVGIMEMPQTNQAGNELGHWSPFVKVARNALWGQKIEAPAVRREAR